MSSTCPLAFNMLEEQGKPMIMIGKHDVKRMDMYFVKTIIHFIQFNIRKINALLWQ
jgi:5S rRNA maturation endonuclease (ribonuclease M5)